MDGSRIIRFRSAFHSNGRRIINLIDYTLINVNRERNRVLILVTFKSHSIDCQISRFRDILLSEIKIVNRCSPCFAIGEQERSFFRKNAFQISAHTQPELCSSCIAVNLCRPDCYSETRAKSGSLNGSFHNICFAVPDFILFFTQFFPYDRNLFRCSVLVDCGYLFRIFRFIS